MGPLTCAFMDSCRKMAKYTQRNKKQQINLRLKLQVLHRFVAMALNTVDDDDNDDCGALTGPCEPIPGRIGTTHSAGHGPNGHGKAIHRRNSG